MTPRTAADVRARNAELDEELRAIAAQVTVEVLGRDPGGEEWTVAQVLAHLGEFPRFFAQDLERWLDECGQVGRTVEHPVRLAAVAEAERADLGALLAGIDAAFAELARVLERVEDRHVDAVTDNRKYGTEPMTAYLERYVLGHKAAHVEQLRRTLEQVTRDPG